MQMDVDPKPIARIRIEDSKKKKKELESWRIVIPSSMDKHGITINRMVYNRMHANTLHTADGQSKVSQASLSDHSPVLAASAGGLQWICRLYSHRYRPTSSHPCSVSVRSGPLQPFISALRGPGARLHSLLSVHKGKLSLDISAFSRTLRQAPSHSRLVCFPERHPQNTVQLQICTQAMITPTQSNLHTIRLMYAPLYTILILFVCSFNGTWSLADLASSFEGAQADIRKYRVKRPQQLPNPSFPL